MKKSSSENMKNEVFSQDAMSSSPTVQTHRGSLKVYLREKIYENAVFFAMSFWLPSNDPPAESAARPREG